MRTRVKKFLTLLVLGIFLLFSMTACGNEGSHGKASSATETIQKNEEASSGTEKTTEKNETGVALDGSVISWANMKIDNPDLQLTEDQIEVLKYFDNDYFWITNYDSLQRYPKIYRDAQIYFEGTVIQMLETDDETYQCLVWMNGYLDEKGELIQPENQELVVVSGKHPEDARVVEGDWLIFYGR